jgi:hypothetical protein
MTTAAAAAAPGTPHRRARPAAPIVLATTGADGARAIDAARALAVRHGGGQTLLTFLPGPASIDVGAAP